MFLIIEKYINNQLQFRIKVNIFKGGIYQKTTILQSQKFNFKYFNIYHLENIPFEN